MAIAVVLLVVVVVLAVALGAALTGGFGGTRRMEPGPATPAVRGPDADLVRRAMTLPPSPERTFVRLRVELIESVQAAATAVEVLGSDRERFLDLDGTLDRLRRVATDLDGRLARAERLTGPGAADLVPPLRTRVRAVQESSDRLVEVAGRALTGTDPELRRLAEQLDAEVAVLDAHDELEG